MFRYNTPLDSIFSLFTALLLLHNCFYWLVEVVVEREKEEEAHDVRTTSERTATDDMVLPTGGRRED